MDMKLILSFLMSFLMTIGASVVVADVGLPLYTNAHVLGIDAAGRTLVIRNARGVQERVELDDNVAGFQDVKVGDHVILALRGEPGRSRVSAIFKGKESSTSESSASKTVSGSAMPVGDEAPLARASNAAAASTFFAGRVAAVAAQAAHVDRVWGEFRQACGVTVGGRYDGGREWFALWDGQVRADLSQGFCRDLHNQVVSLGEAVNVEMAAAEDAARRSLAPGDIRDIRRRYALEWDGWGRIPPRQLEK
jgi:hypothetical protein